MLDVLDRLTRARAALPAAAPHLRGVAAGLRGAAGLLDLLLGAADEGCPPDRPPLPNGNAPPAEAAAPPPARARPASRGRRAAAPPEGQRLARALVARHGSARAAAAEHGLNAASLGRWAAGRTAPRGELLDALRGAVEGADEEPGEAQGEDADEG